MNPEDSIAPWGRQALGCPLVPLALAFYAAMGAVAVAWRLLVRRPGARSSPAGEACVPERRPAAPARPSRTAGGRVA